MKKIFSFLFVAAMSSSAAYAETKFAPVHAETHNNVACVKVTEDEVIALFDRWNAALATLNPEEVAEEYAHDAILLPTVSNQPRTNHEEIKDYFEHFLQKKPVGKVDFRIIKLGCNTASDTGLYTFTLHEKDGKVKHVKARYSFVYEYDDDQWLIEHHHSSMMPEDLIKAQKHMESYENSQQLNSSKSVKSLKKNSRKNKHSHIHSHKHSHKHSK